jgi:hypothetical protein
MPHPAAVGQMTSAGKLIHGFTSMGSPSRGPRRRRKAKATKVRSKRRKSGKPARLVKGSAAAKAYMAKIRRKRR